MSNVIPLRRCGPSLDGGGEDARRTAALVADLVGIAEALKAAGDQAAGLSRPALQVERTVQLILDAMSSAESAADALTDEGDYLPF